MKQLYIFSLAFNLILADEKADSLGNNLPLKPTRTISFTTDEGTWMFHLMESQLFLIL